MLSSFRAHRIIILILLLAAIIRLPRLVLPISGRYAMNEASAEAMCDHLRYTVEEFLFPKVDWFTNTSMSRVYIQESPIYHAICRGVHMTSLPLTMSARITSLLFGLSTILFLYLLCDRYYGQQIAVAASALCVFCPLSWYNDTSVMSDVAMSSSMYAGFFFFLRWNNDHRRHLDMVLSAMLICFAGLFKPYGFMIGIAMAVQITMTRGVKSLFIPAHLAYAATMLLPGILWTIHALSANAGANDIKSAHHILHFSMLTDPTILSSFVGERIIMSLLSAVWLPFFVLGLITVFTHPRSYSAAMSLLVMCGFYLLLVAPGNFAHEYYQLPMTPTVCLTTAIGITSYLHTRDPHPLSRQWILLTATCTFIAVASVWAINAISADPVSVKSAYRLAVRVLIPLVSVAAVAGSLANSSAKTKKQVLALLFIISCAVSSSQFYLMSRVDKGRVLLSSHLTQVASPIVVLDSDWMAGTTILRNSGNIGWISGSPNLANLTHSDSPIEQLMECKGLGARTLAVCLLASDADLYSDLLSSLDKRFECEWRKPSVDHFGRKLLLRVYSM
ncbi:ArnT family glycosyltransferase [Rubinisphaera sp. JC750]|uniref:ArnT family glycosyltransferase n=1 Tax=Rubinisphaera sp. JC750 TaxID=2898658 RepID=UPI0028F3EFE4|nr:glycosyltransferase family 39 protein [Rubinisphaera sp. JC750]